MSWTLKMKLKIRDKSVSFGTSLSSADFISLKRISSQ